jgi:hypothetical protein
MKQIAYDRRKVGENNIELRCNGTLVEVHEVVPHTYVIGSHDDNLRVWTFMYGTCPNGGESLEMFEGPMTYWVNIYKSPNEAYDYYPIGCYKDLDTASDHIKDSDRFVKSVEITLGDEDE